jgi:molybdate transport system substrate-binding protein
MLRRVNTKANPRHHRLARTAIPLAIALVLAAPAAAHAVSVYAAASLTTAFPRIDGSPTFNFAGSNQLQLQIERGAPADVFAAASPREAQALFRAGRCGRPVTFATNVLVMITPRANRAGLRSAFDLRRGRHRIAIGTAGVPIGAYTRQILARMGLTSILRTNTVSQEPNVSGVVSKVALGSADAGFAYLTDWRAARSRLGLVRLPARFQPPVRYQICAVRRPGADSAGARVFIERVRSDRGRRILRGAGFGLPPRG